MQQKPNYMDPLFILLGFIFNALFIWLFFLGVSAAYRKLNGYHSSRLSAELPAIKVKIPLSLPQEDSYPYRRRDYFFSEAEKNFYAVLEQIATASNLVLFAKVRLEDLLWIPRYTKNILRWRGYVRSRHIDFVLCDKSVIKPICAIELDDQSHNTHERIRRDQLIDKILESAELPLLRIRLSYSYDPTDIAKRIQAAITPEVGSLPAPSTYTSQHHF
jgi:hypothetical protein